MLEKKKKSVDTLQEETDLMEVLSKLLELEKDLNSFLKFPCEGES